MSQGRAVRSTPGKKQKSSHGAEGFLALGRQELHLHLQN